MRGPASRESPAYVGTRDRVELNDSIFQQLVQIVFGAASHAGHRVLGEQQQRFRRLLLNAVEARAPWNHKALISRESI